MIGDELKVYKEKNNLTSEEMAMKLGVNVERYNKIENNIENAFTYSLYKRINTLLGKKVGPQHLELSWNSPVEKLGRLGLSNIVETIHGFHKVNSSLIGNLSWATELTRNLQGSIAFQQINNWQDNIRMSIPSTFAMQDMLGGLREKTIPFSTAINAPYEKSGLVQILDAGKAFKAIHDDLNKYNGFLSYYNGVVELTAPKFYEFGNTFKTILNQTSYLDELTMTSFDVLAGSIFKDILNTLPETDFDKEADLLKGIDEDPKARAAAEGLVREAYEILRKGKQNKNLIKKIWKAVQRNPILRKHLSQGGIVLLVSVMVFFAKCASEYAIEKGLDAVLFPNETSEEKILKSNEETIKSNNQVRKSNEKVIKSNQKTPITININVGNQIDSICKETDLHISNSGRSKKLYRMPVDTSINVVIDLRVWCKVEVNGDTTKTGWVKKDSIARFK